MGKICVLDIYLGVLPGYFDLWLKSASHNPDIDFLVFTDNERDNLPSNVKFIPMSLSELQTLASEKIGFNVCLKHPYKCCDFKPACGKILEDYLKDYEYWGHCDLDVVFGDLSGYFKKYSLDKYDKFLDKGHLSLHKNCNSVNNAFMYDGINPGYKEVFTSEQNYAFDEFGYIQILKTMGYKLFTERIFADISKIYKRYRCALDDKNYDYQCFYWEKGHIYRAFLEGKDIKTEEFIYIHFKERGKLPINNEYHGVDKFYITRYGFYWADSYETTLDDIKRYNPFPGAYVEKFELIKFTVSEFYKRVLRKIRKLLGLKQYIRKS